MKHVVGGLTLLEVTIEFDVSCQFKFACASENFVHAWNFQCFTDFVVHPPPVVPTNSLLHGSRETQQIYGK